MIDRVEQKGKWEFDKEVTGCFEDMLKRSIPQIAPIIDKFGATNHYYLTEVSDPMLYVLQERFKEWDYSKIITIQKCDLRDEFPNIQASVILSVLTLMFIPLECRQALIQKIYDALLPGGAFICIEKVLGASAVLEKVLTKLYYQKKADSGYSTESIERKRLSLQGVLVPITASWENELLYMAGFRYVECFWRWMNFAGWIALKN